MDSFSIGFSARSTSDGPSERKRVGERETERERERATTKRQERGRRRGLGININIIALIALDRGGARAYDTLQITRGDGTRWRRRRRRWDGETRERGREEERGEERAGWLCR